MEFAEELLLTLAYY